MLEMELLQEAFRQRLERLHEARRDKAGRIPAAERTQDPSLACDVKKALEIIAAVPDVRRDRVEEIKKRLRDGRLDADPEKIAESLLQESILNELL